MHKERPPSGLEVTQAERSCLHKNGKQNVYLYDRIKAQFDRAKIRVAGHFRPTHIPSIFLALKILFTCSFGDCIMFSKPEQGIEHAEVASVP